MKKFLLTICSITVFGFVTRAQVTNTTTPPPTSSSNTPSQNNFDKKFRFGLKASLQPTWLQSGNTSSKGNGAYFGYGFGLAMEFKLSNIIHFLTGIGGDFEGGKISYRNDATFAGVKEVIDNEGALVEAKKGIASSEYDLKSGNASYILKERQFKTTTVTIPLLLKMMTAEYSGLRYFADFGAELGIRAAVKANDSFYSGLMGNGTPTAVVVAEGDLKKDNIMVGKDASLIPMRFGMNLGLGFEYRIAGSTSIAFSANYFQSFTNLMRNDSKYLTKDQTLDPATNTYTFSSLSQSYLMRAVRINIALMF